MWPILPDGVGSTQVLSCDSSCTQERTLTTVRQAAGSRASPAGDSVFTPMPEGRGTQLDSSVVAAGARSIQAPHACATHSTPAADRASPRIAAHRKLPHAGPA